MSFLFFSDKSEVQIQAWNPIESLLIPDWMNPLSFSSEMSDGLASSVTSMPARPSTPFPGSWPTLETISWNKESKHLLSFFSSFSLLFVKIQIDVFLVKNVFLRIQKSPGSQSWILKRYKGFVNRMVFENCNFNRPQKRVEIRHNLE